VRIRLRGSMLKVLTAADVLSILNAIFGLLAMLAVVAGSLVWGFALILLALLADGLDGVVARRFGGGQVGEYLEAMADLVSLTIAPLVFVFAVYQRQVLWSGWLVVLVGSMVFFLFCAATRLASFHLLKDEAVFVGLPASAGAILLISMGMLPEWFSPLVVPVVLVLLGVMKVSSVRFPKLTAVTAGVASVVILIALVLTLLGTMVGALLLLVMILVYILAGAFVARKKPVSMVSSEG